MYHEDSVYKAQVMMRKREEFLDKLREKELIKDSWKHIEELRNERKKQEMEIGADKIILDVEKELNGQIEILIAGSLVMSDDFFGAMNKWRRLFGLTQFELANRMNISMSVISDYGKRRKNPKINSVKRIVTAMLGKVVLDGKQRIGKAKTTA